MHSNEQPLLPTRFSSPSQGSFGAPGMIISNNSDSPKGKVFSAPLGGLPAMESQIEEATEDKSLNGNALDKSGINEDSDDENLSSDPTDDAIEGNNNNEAKTNPNSLGSKSSTALRKDESANSSLETSPGGSKAIKAKGTYYPLTAFPTSMPQGPVMRKGDESPPRNESAPGKTYLTKSRLGIFRFVIFSLYS